MHNRFSSWGGTNTFCTSWNCMIKKQNRWTNTNQCWWKKDQNVQWAVSGVSTHESIWGRMTVRWHFFNICQGNFTWMYPPYNDSGLASWKLCKGKTSGNPIVRSSIYSFQAFLVSASFCLCYHWQTKNRNFLPTVMHSHKMGGAQMQSITLFYKQ